VRTDPLSIVGVELGARMEDTAISVIERAWVPTGELFKKVRRDYAGGYAGGRSRLESREKVTVEYRVRHLERRSPPVHYKGIASRVAELVETVGECVVVMDLTPTGRPLHALIINAVLEVTKATRSPRVSQCPITVTGEYGAVSHSPHIGWLVPRRELVSAALPLFEQEQLKIAEALDLAEVLTREFTDFKPKAPKEELEGWRLAKNDLLVLAVAMSVWAAERFLRKEESVAAGASVPRSCTVCSHPEREAIDQARRKLLDAQHADLRKRELERVDQATSETPTSYIPFSERLAALQRGKKRTWR
jgi:hypothetical protein